MPGNNQADNPPNEKREFFRIDHDLLFEYKLVESYTAENEDPEAVANDDAGDSLALELRKIDKELQQSLHIVAQTEPNVGNALTKLNRKIDKILKYSVFNSDNEKHKAKINLSEGGIAFKSDRLFYKGNYLLLRLVFLPSYLPVLLFAKVVRCDAKNDEYHVAARFHRASEQAQKELAKQILKAQQQSARREAAKHKLNDH